MKNLELFLCVYMKPKGFVLLCHWQATSAFEPRLAFLPINAFYSLFSSPLLICMNSWTKITVLLQYGLSSCHCAACWDILSLHSVDMLKFTQCRLYVCVMHKWNQKQVRSEIKPSGCWCDGKWTIVNSCLWWISYQCYSSGLDLKAWGIWEMRRGTDAPRGQRADGQTEKGTRGRVRRHCGKLKT